MSLLKLIESDLTDTFEFEYKNKKQKIIIKPLTLKEVAELLEKHTSQMANLLSGSPDLFKNLTDKAPEFLADFICYGLEEKISPDMVQKLPLTIQFKIAEAIWNVTVIDGEYLGKFVGRIASALGKAARMVPSAGVNQEKIKEALEESRKQLENTGK